MKISVTGGIVTEVLLKGNRSGLDGGKSKFNFMDMQTWLYFYGVLLNFSIFCLTNHDFTLEDFKQNMFGKKMPIHYYYTKTKEVSSSRCQVAKMAHDGDGNHGDSASRNGGGQVCFIIS